MTISRRHLIAAAPASLLAADAMTQTIGDRPEAATGLRLTAGLYPITRDTVIRGDVSLDPGARFTLAAGATLKFLGHFEAPIGPVFSGPGRVELAEGRTLEAYPEWWGAQPESGVDCIAAMEACHAAHPIMRLGPHSYYISRTLVIDRHSRHVRGSGQRWVGPHTGSRIVLTGSGDVMRIGSLRQPPTINDFLQGVMVSDLMLTRAGPASGSGHDAPAGLRIRYTLFADVSRVWSTESINGFAIGGAVRTYLRDCTAFRSVKSGSPVFRGFACDGLADIGAAGGNASIFLVDCNASIGGEPGLTESVGLLLDGAFADTFASNFETASMAVGIRLTGRASALSADKRRSGHVDVRILAPVIDQCTDVGIEVTDTSNHTLIDISDPYVAAGPAARAAMLFNGARGQTTVRGGQLIGWTSRNAVGLFGNESEGLDFSGLKLMQFKAPVRLTKCRDLNVALAINQPDGGNNGPAVVLADCAETLVATRVKGAPRSFTAGISVTGGETRSVDVKVAAIREDSVGGAERRVMFSGVPNGAVTLS